MNTIGFQNVYQTITARGEFKRGERYVTPDGREWVFGQAQSAVGTAGFIVVPDAVTTSDLWSSSADAQGRIVYLSRAANTLTVGQFEDGIGVVDQGTGVGQTFKIRTNSATTLTLYPETALATALAVADSDLTFIVMSYWDAAAVTSKIQMAQGGVQVAFAAADFGFALSEGDGRAVAGEVLIVGSGFTTGDDTAGEVIKGITAKGALDEQNLGYCVIANDAADQGTLVRYFIR